jgi:hypothetical protein
MRDARVKRGARNGEEIEEKAESNETKQSIVLFSS